MLKTALPRLLVLNEWCSAISAHVDENGAEEKAEGIRWICAQVI